ncbi:MAG: histidine kinase [Eggerthellaceae bacterium]
MKAIQAAIISPLVMSNKVVGTLKFYYAHPHFINDTEKSIAEGFASILSTQIAAAAMEQQRKLATSMELRALQTQINPHFLFNTLNTIAAFIRMDPDKARVLLREFATFYRKTLENEGDLIELSKESGADAALLHVRAGAFRRGHAGA